MNDRKVNIVHLGAHGGIPGRPTAPKPTLAAAILRLLSK